VLLLAQAVVPREVSVWKTPGAKDERADTVVVARSDGFESATRGTRSRHARVDAHRHIDYTYKHSPITCARANNIPQVTRPPHTSTHVQGTDPRVALGAYGELPHSFIRCLAVRQRHQGSSTGSPKVTPTKHLPPPPQSNSRPLGLTTCAASAYRRLIRCQAVRQRSQDPSTGTG